MTKQKVLLHNIFLYLGMFTLWSLWQIYAEPIAFPGASWGVWVSAFVKGVIWTTPMFLLWKREGWLVQPSKAFFSPFPWLPCLGMLCAALCFLYTVRIAAGRQNTVLIWEHIFLLSSISAGVIEEIAFRGLLFNRLAPKTGIFPAAMMNGLMFALFHYPQLIIGQGWEQLASPRFLMLFCVGGLFSLAFARWKNLWLLIIVHSSWNIFSYLFTLTG